MRENFRFCRASRKELIFYPVIKLTFICFHPTNNYTTSISNFHKIPRVLLNFQFGQLPKIISDYVALFDYSFDRFAVESAAVESTFMS